MNWLSMLKSLRKKIFKNKEKLKELDEFLGKQSRRFYLEQNYRDNKLFKYFFFLRKEGVDLNNFFDNEIKKYRDE